MPRILIIDDDNDLLDVTKSLLVRRGLEVEVMCNWEDTFKTIGTFRPQVILLDVFLSGIDGLEICKQLKSQAATKHIPVIIFSAYPRVAETIYEYGADDFIAKPFEVQELISKLHSVLSQKAGMA